MLRPLFLLLVLFQFLPPTLNAQSHKSHWYFGIGSGIRFENGQALADSNANINAYIGSVSMSDSSGNLLFYTNGRAFFNRNHVKMLGSTGSNSAISIDVIALPSTIEAGVYFVYVVENYYISVYKVDMNKDGGLGEVIESGRFLPENGYFVETVTALKNCESNSYWLLSVHRIHDSYDLISYEIDMSNGHIRQSHSFPIDEDIKYIVWDMVSSSDGNYIAMVTAVGTHLIEFDTNCGKFIRNTVLPLPGSDFKPRGACFSPNDTYLYLTYTVGNKQDEGWVFQVDYKNLGNPDLFKHSRKTPYFLYTLLNGPDNRMYLLTHHVEGGHRTIDRIEKPDVLWNSNSYQEGVVKYPYNGGLLPFLPNFVNDNTNCSKPQSPGFEPTSFCVDDTVTVQLLKADGYDSVFLVDRTLGRYYEFDENNETSLAPKPSGTHRYELVWRLCSEKNRKKQVNIQVYDYPVIARFDTTLCSGDSFELPVADTGLLRTIEFKDQGQWQGYNGEFFKNKGLYKVQLENKACTSIDSFELKITPPLITSLGDSFSFCEEEGVPIVLDAGKGFNGYRWHPTGDSTQWIAVMQKGDYYVIVSDSRGCSGRGDTRVYSDCEPRIYIPNAFSPNGNGHNDSFYINGQYIIPLSMQVYDRWGAIVHYSAGNRIAWDGTKNGEIMPIGTYVFVLTYKEVFYGKSRTLSGPIHLLR